MNDFIKVHFIGDGEALRINKCGINVFYWQRDKKQTHIITDDGESYNVKETPIEIEKMIERTVYNEEEDPYKKVIEME